MRRQLAALAAAIAAGAPRVGWKICINDPRMQARLGLATPFVGWLNGRRLVQSGGRYPVGGGAALACEPEIAIRIGGTTGDLTSLDGARAAIAAVAAAIEVVDYARLPPALAVVVETASFHDGVVLGDARPPAAAPTLGPDCPRLLRNGAPAGEVDPSLVPEDLALVVRDVATFLRRYGQALRTGDWILSGACAPAVRVCAGDEVAADFGSLGVVAAHFAA